MSFASRAALRGCHAPCVLLSRGVVARQLLQVRGLLADGFGLAWYLCTVGASNKRNCVDVICTDFVEDDGKPVVDRVEKSRMRPLPPQGPGAPLETYAEGQQVDVHLNDCWWEATLQTVEAGVACVQINSMCPGLGRGRAGTHQSPRTSP